jgi:hypothetical protein
MITNNQTGLLVFTEALAKALIHKGVFAKSEFVRELEAIRDDKDYSPADHTAIAAQVDMMIARIERF